MRKKRALVIGVGGLRGTYDAGVAFTLCRELGPDYFDAIYACSAGAYTAAHFALNQPDSGENVWRNYLDGNKLVNFFNLFHGRQMFDLEYLTDVFKSGETLLHAENLSRIPTVLTYVLTELHSGNPIYVQPTPENIFDFMKASSAMPFLHSPIILDGVAYIDGGLSDPLPFAKAKADGYEDIMIIYSKPRNFLGKERYDISSRLFAACISPQIASLLKRQKLHSQNIEHELESEKDIKIIRPKNQLPLTSFIDSDKGRMNATFDMGIADAREFLKTYHG